MHNLSDKNEMIRLADIYEAERKGKIKEPFSMFPVAEILGIHRKSNSKISFKCKAKNGEIFNLDVADYHEQDCCENVYADWDTFFEFVNRNFTPGKYESVQFCGVEEAGFLVKLETASGYESFFCPCYNVQNGYYSSALSLIFSTRISISDFVKDEID